MQRLFRRRQAALPDSQTPLPARTAFALWAPTYGAGNDNPLLPMEELLIAPHLVTLVPAGAVVADVGCGTGRHFPHLAALGARTVVGIDASPEMLARCGGMRGGAAFVACARAERLPLRDRSCDAALATLVLSYITRLDVAIAELARILRPGGRLLLADLHPHSASAGWQRTFTLPGQGLRTIAHVPHSTEAYRRAFERHALAIETVEEPVIDERLEGVFRRFGALRSYKRQRGTPLLLIQRLVRR